MVIILLIRALANAINKEIWRAFLDKKSEVQAVWEKTRNKKEKAAQKLLTQASKPAALQIKEQVSLEIDQKLKLAKRKQETADTKKSAKKQKFSAKDSRDRNKSPDRAFRKQRKHSDMDRSRSTSYTSRKPQHQQHHQDYQQHGYHDDYQYQPSSRSSRPPPPSGYSATDPYSIHRAPMHIFENQVIPRKIHNLSKTFVPNLTGNRVLSLGTKFAPTKVAPVWADIFENFNDFKRKLKNKMFFHLKYGNQKMDGNFPFFIKSIWETDENFPIIDNFCWSVRDRIADLVNSKSKTKAASNLSNAEKTALKKLITT
jgi:hypothetical protein